MLWYVICTTSVVELTVLLNYLIHGTSVSVVSNIFNSCASVPVHILVLQPLYYLELVNIYLCAFYEFR